MELLERDPFLDELGHLLDDAASRRGRILFLGGEAGVGKSSLVDAFFRQVDQRVDSIRSTCDALSTPGPLSSVRVHASALGVTFAPHPREGQARDELFHAMFDALDRRDAPILMVGEDAHWADDASLDLVRYIGRRVDRLPLLLIVTYRDDEVGASHPLRRVLGDLATAPGYRRLILPPLSVAAVRQLARDSAIDPVTLHRQTGGNPFYVTEVLATGSDAVPMSVSDAVLARASRLSAPARDLLNTGAAIGARIDVDVLMGITGPALDEIEECIEGGLLHAEGDMLSFRHQLARDAVYAAIIPPRRRLLHARILAELRDLPARHEHLAELAHHAELAQDWEATLEFAPAAAEQASALGAHREAAEQYARALRHAESLEPVDRATLLECWSYECYLTNRPQDAVTGRLDALAIWREQGNALKEGENLRWLSRVSWLAGQAAAAEEAGRAALAVLEPLPPGPQLAWAYSNLSQLRMLASDNAGAIEWGERAIALAEKLGEREVLIHALNNVGTAGAGEDHGIAYLERSLALSLEGGLDDHAARAWTNLSSGAVMQMQLGAARQYLADGIAFTTERDLDSLRMYMTAWRAVLHMYQGDWPAAETDCATVLSQPHAAAVSRVLALTTLGLLRARRGEPDAMPLLDEALALAEPMDAPIRVGPVRMARAEVAWLAGDPAGVESEARALLVGMEDRLDPWLRGEVATWLAQCGAQVDLTGEIAAPCALEVGGNTVAAAAAWQALGCPYEAARARLGCDDEGELRAALAAFERLGAPTAAAIAIQRLRDTGARMIPRGPHRATREHPAGLTAREAEILALISEGSTNREIADRLYLSPKTVEHHVTAILTKLNVPTRRDATRIAVELGLAPGKPA